MTVYQIDNVLVKISVPESEISHIKKGDRAKVVIPALGQEEFYGSFEEIGAVANIISHTYDAKIKIANPQKKLKPGMVSNVYITKNTSSGAISLPANAVSEDNGVRFVYIVSADGNSVIKKEVRIGNYSGDNIIIRDGVNVGDRVVVSGNQKLYNGAPVSVKN
jgi:RND family efflux transporter MFP subunit